jgi:hypothetical protein
MNVFFLVQPGFSPCAASRQATQDGRRRNRLRHLTLP